MLARLCPFSGTSDKSTEIKTEWLLHHSDIGSKSDFIRRFQLAEINRSHLRCSG